MTIRTKAWTCRRKSEIGGLLDVIMRISNAPWSSREDRELAEAVKANVSVQRRAVRFGRPSMSIRRRVRELGMEPPLRSRVAHAPLSRTSKQPCIWTMERAVNNIIYIVGLIVVVLAVLAFFGLR